MSEIEKAEPEVTKRLERVIWKRMGNKSTVQIAKETGLPVDTVQRVKRELLEGVDDLTIAQKKQKLIVELEAIAQEAREAAEDADDEFRAGLYNSSIAAMKAMLVELNRLEKADTTRVDALNEMRVRELVSLMYEVIDSGVPVAAERYDIDADELFQIFNEALVRAAARREIAE